MIPGQNFGDIATKNFVIANREILAVRLRDSKGAGEEIRQRALHLSGKHIVKLSPFFETNRVDELRDWNQVQPS